MNRLVLKLSALSLQSSSLCPAGGALVACLTRVELTAIGLHRTVLGGWHFIPIKGLAAMLFSLCCHAILIDH